MKKYSHYKDLIDFAEQYIELEEAGSYEMKGNCVFCDDEDGHDRFFINGQNEEKPYCYCRKCEQWAHNIQQFCYRFLKMSWQEAEQAAGARAFQPKIVSSRHQPAIICDRKKWEAKACSVTQTWNKILLKHPQILDWLETERGITIETTRRWKLGLCPKEYFLKPETWGFEPTDKMVYCPIGITIPHTQQGGEISGVNMRLFKPTDDVYKVIYPQSRVLPIPMPNKPYKRIRGSQSSPWVLPGETCCFTHGQFNEPCKAPIDEFELSKRPVIVVESELDALLLWQHLKQFVTVIALLSASNKPVKTSLPHGPILFALDFDDAGKRQFKKWRAEYNAIAAPPEEGKDITDMIQRGVNPLDWLARVLEYHQLLRPDILNPYAHAHLLHRLYKSKNQPLALPIHLIRECTTGLVHTWYMDCHDIDQRRKLELRYQQYWGIHS